MTDSQIEIQEALKELFHDTHRISYTTSEIMEQVGVEADRHTYLKVLRNTNGITETKAAGNDGKYAPSYWILGRLNTFQTLEQRVSKLEEYN